MAKHKSAQKAARQADKKAERNGATLSRTRGAVKALRTALEGKKKATEENLAPLLTQAQSALMTAASRGAIKARNASRKVSRLSLAVDKALKG